MFYDIVTIGELNADLILTGLDGIPELGKEILAQDFSLSIGGSTVLFAIAATKLGLKVNFISKVGSDLYGNYLLKELERLKVDTSNIKVCHTLKTGFTVALSLKRDRAFATFLGTINSLTYEDIPPDALRQANHLHISSYFLQKNLQKDCLRIFKEAKRQGLTTSLDTGYDPEEKWNSNLYKILEYTDVFLPNRTEAINISGYTDLNKAIQLLSRCSKLLVVKLGADGAILAKAGEVMLTHPSFKVKVVDTTGAGDCFNAGFLYGYLNNWELYKCLQFACACGSLSVRVAGGASGIKSREQVDEFIRKQLNKKHPPRASSPIPAQTKFGA